MFKSVLIAVVVHLVASPAWGASPYKRSLHEKKNAYLSDGVFIGGRAQVQGVALLGVRRAFSPKSELERVIVSLGDREAKPLSDQVGYFQASMDPANRRMVLDIAQMQLSKVSEAQVQRLFRKSPNVASVEFTMDPQDKAASMVVNFKRPMRLEVFQLRKPARIVLDMTPQPAGRS